MTDIAMHFNAASRRFDLAQVEPGDGYNGIRDDRDLYTAVLASLFTWARADDEDPLPGFDDDRKGWWGDSFPRRLGDVQGSKLWLLSREILNDVTVERARGYVVDALQWLIEDGVVDQVIVKTARGDTRLAVFVTLLRPDGEVIEYRFNDAWQQITGEQS